jgi:hypothetical protein
MAAPHFLMSRKVAATYLEKLTLGRLCMTVYFSSKADMDKFTNRLVDLYSQTLSLSKGFDHVTFWSEDPLIIQDIKARCEKHCLDYSDI